MMARLGGRAFLIDSHKDLCPSSPYVWKKEKCAGLSLRTRGVDAASPWRADLFSFMSGISVGHVGIWI